MSPKKFISTTLPYINSKPHIGHCFEFVLADVITRFYRDEFDYFDVLFNTGVDEHGIKVQQAAEREGTDPRLYCDRLAGEWQNFCDRFAIDYNNFYRTSDPEHKEKALNVFKFLRDKGVLKKKTYKGYYCEGCESFITQKEVIRKKNKKPYCPIHRTELKLLKENNWFFEFKKEYYISDTILKDISLSKELNEINKNFKEISITRENVKWAIEVDDEPGTTLYVWFEALLNYFFVVGLNINEEIGGNPQFYWRRGLIICGKDNLKFQAFVLQHLAITLGYGRSLEILVHGTILDEAGNKMSKTTGNVIDPVEQLEKYGQSPVRLYLCFGLNTFQNSKYSEVALINLWNDFVVNGFGNSVSRVLHLIDYRKVEIYEETTPVKFSNFDIRFIEEHLHESFLNYNIGNFGGHLKNLIQDLSESIAKTKPWSEETEDFGVVLNEYYHVLKVIGKYISYVIPEYSSAIKKAFREKKKVILFNKIEQENIVV